MSIRAEVRIEPLGDDGVGLLVQAAATRVRTDSAGWGARALSTDSARSRLAEIVRSVSNGVPFVLPVDEATPAEKSLCRHLIDLLRRALLTGAVDDRATDDGRAATNAAELIQALRRLEEIRQGLEPEWHESLATGLTGLDALELLVEVAHDLRSPLTSIMFLAETLRRGQRGRLRDVERQQLGIIYSAALNLSGIASNLIDLGRGETSPPATGDGGAPFSIAEMLDRVRGMVAPMAEEKGLNLILHPPPHDGRVGDAVALSRILLNLTANALKFTDRGSIEVRAEETGGDMLEFSVTDTGRGMDKRTVASLFEPFRRSRNRSGFQFSGPGLGLVITRRMLEQMGSELHVRSRPGHGSRFSFQLELPRVDRE